MENSGNTVHLCPANWNGIADNPGSNAQAHKKIETVDIFALNFF